MTENVKQKKRRQTMGDQNKQVCGSAAKLIFSCSGAADVGAIADKAARRLNQKGTGKMFCTVGLGGKVKPILKATREASTILALDGCALDCTRHSLKQAGFDEFVSVRITDLGMEKGKAPVTDENINTVVNHCKKQLTGA